jgi:hypothetical protein
MVLLPDGYLHFYNFIVIIMGKKADDVMRKTCHSQSLAVSCPVGYSLVHAFSRIRE